MKKIIEDNYNSILKRGLITPETSFSEFIDKIYEELREFEEECIINKYPLEYIDIIPFEEIKQKQKDRIQEEASDIILTVLNFLKHNGFDIEKGLKEKIKINQNR